MSESDSLLSADKFNSNGGSTETDQSRVTANIKLCSDLTACAGLKWVGLVPEATDFDFPLVSCYYSGAGVADPRQTTAISMTMRALVQCITATLCMAYLIPASCDCTQTFRRRVLLEDIKR